MTAVAIQTICYPEFEEKSSAFGILENFWSTITIDIKKFNENVQKTVQEKTGLKLTSQTQVVEQPRREMLQEGLFQKIIIS